MSEKIATNCCLDFRVISTILGFGGLLDYHYLSFNFTKKTLAIQSQEELDACGLTCPEPLMLVRNKVRKMHSGEILHVYATDPTTERDVTQFCQFLGHVMLKRAEQSGVYEFWIQKC